MKRPRGRPPRVSRQPQDPSKWPPLLPKPSTRLLLDVYKNSETSKELNGSNGSLYLTSPLASSSGIEAYPTSPACTIMPHFPLDVNDMNTANFPGGVLPLSVEMAIGSGEINSNPSSDEVADQQPMVTLQDMSEGVQVGIKVRGLDLMRYGRLENGIYKCTECERINIAKTFKTSYSFQRHAYLYHEGSPKRFPCPVCGKEFSRPDKRKSHLKEKHGMFNGDNVEADN